LTWYAAAADFLAAVRPALEEHEAEHHLLLGVAESVASGRFPNASPFAVAVSDAQGLALAAFMMRDRPLLLASDRSALDESASTLVWEALANADRAATQVIGSVGQVESFVAARPNDDGTEPRLVMRQRVYKLAAVEPLPAVTGALRVATDADLDIAMEWMHGFEVEALAGIQPAVSRDAMARKIAGGELYFWRDSEPRAMAGWARPTKRAIAVNAVYTPPAWRGRGYATACVASLSSELLRRGYDFCVLYTDLANPTSNAIYQRIGYQAVRDFLMFDLSGVSRVVQGVVQGVRPLETKGSDPLNPP
jgi:predicted GNAT family acetyltransferase